MKHNHPTVYLYTGNGAGKTTASFGACLRTIGWNNRAVIVQFMKCRKEIGEVKIAKKLGRNFEIYQFGLKGWVDLKNPSIKDIEAAQKGLEFVENVVLKNPPHVLVLDEVNLAAAIGLLKINSVLQAIDKFPSSTTIFMTGRFAPKEFITRADTATEMVLLKHVLENRGIKAQKGIQY